MSFNLPCMCEQKCGKSANLKGSTRTSNSRASELSPMHLRLLTVKSTCLYISRLKVSAVILRRTTAAMSTSGEQQRYKLGEKASLVLRTGDLTKWKGDAIVNAANEQMLGGGGVDGAIHRAAGPDLLKACREVPEVKPGVRCPTGEARITGGFNLPARHVIHTVGPIYCASHKEESRKLLYDAYRNSLKLANEHKLHEIAFPAISCGVYGYPIPEAAEVSLEACRAHVGNLQEIHFVLFGETTFASYCHAAKHIVNERVRE